MHKCNIFTVTSTQLIIFHFLIKSKTGVKISQNYSLKYAVNFDVTKNDHEIANIYAQNCTMNAIDRITVLSTLFDENVFYISLILPPYEEVRFLQKVQLPLVFMSASVLKSDGKEEGDFSLVRQFTPSSQSRITALDLDFASVGVGITDSAETWPFTETYMTSSRLTWDGLVSVVMHISLSWSNALIPSEPLLEREILSDAESVVEIADDEESIVSDGGLSTTALNSVSPESPWRRRRELRRDNDVDVSLCSDRSNKGESVGTYESPMSDMSDSSTLR